MHRPFSFLLAVLLIAPALVGCNKVQARVEMKKGNALYQQEAYIAALEQFKRGLELDPNATFAWRSVGLTALALYRPGDPSPKNADYSKTAIEAFEKYLADYPDDDKVQDYLMTMYVNEKDYDKALAFLDRQAQSSEVPNDPKFKTTRVRILLESNRTDQAWQLAQELPPSQAKAEALYSIGVASWDSSYNDKTLDPVARAQVVDRGLKAVEEALRIKPEYFEAMVYYNLLYREKAKMQEDVTKREEYIALANQWVQKATALRKKQQAEEKAKAAAEAKAASET